MGKVKKTNEQKTHKAERDKAIWEAIEEGHRQHLAARYYDPGQSSAVDSSIIAKWQFEQAMTNLIAMLESANDIDIDWGMDDKAIHGKRDIDEAASRYRNAGSSLPRPGGGKLCSRTVENAIRNYRELVTTYDDVRRLAEKIEQSDQVKRIRVVLARLVWHLFHEGPDRSAEALLADGHKQEAIVVIREAACGARDDVLSELKRLCAEYDLSEQKPENLPTPIIDKDQLKVLNFLVEQFPLSQTHIDIEQRIGITRKTIGSKILPILKTYGFVQIPPKSKTHVVATENGKTYIEKHFS